MALICHFTDGLHCDKVSNLFAVMMAKADQKLQKDFGVMFANLTESSD